METGCDDAWEIALGRFPMKGPKDDLGLCISVLWLLIAAGCATVPQTKDYTAFRSANPRSILIVPPINRSPAVGAPEFVLATLPIPVAEQGYYVFPVVLVKRVLEDEGLADADFVHGSDPVRLCGLFGADSVLYVTVEDWVVAMAGFDVSVNVELDYVLKGCRTGDILWRERKRMSARGGSNDPLASLLANATLRRLPENWVFLPKVRAMNVDAFTTPGQGLPAGPYHEGFGKDINAR